MAGGEYIDGAAFGSLDHEEAELLLEVIRPKHEGFEVGEGSIRRLLAVQLCGFGESINSRLLLAPLIGLGLT